MKSQPHKMHITPIGDQRSSIRTNRSNGISSRYYSHGTHVQSYNSRVKNRNVEMSFLRDKTFLLGKYTRWGALPCQVGNDTSKKKNRECFDRGSKTNDDTRRERSTTKRYSLRVITLFPFSRRLIGQKKQQRRLLTENRRYQVNYNLRHIP